MKNKIQFVLRLLMGLMFLNGGLNKFFNYIPIPEDLPPRVMEMFGAMMTITWLMPLIATFEIIGAVLFVFPRTKALGAVVLTPLMTGIVLHHITLGDPNPLPYILALILVWVIFDNKEKYMPMIK
ncbi:MAG: DoxX family protein [Ekhidna sp.]|uniref:DoxX family protein n=1 Tax=Ekhidna sp. TaxID=2608089 RepID=UPI0032ED9402